MKKNTLFIFLTLFTLNLFAQDTIVLRDATEIVAKVVNIGVSEITYKKWNNLDGPTYQLLRKDIFYIKYANGEKDVFTNMQEKAPSYSTPPKEIKSFIQGVHFNTYLEAGIPFLALEAGPSFNITLGARIYDYGFVGLTFGIDALYGTGDGYHTFRGFDAANFPIMVDFRGYYPINQNLYPFLEFSVGANISTDFGRTQYWNFYPFTSARIRLEGGMEYKRFLVGLGYDCMAVSGVKIHMGYAKIGVRIGK